MINLEYKFAQQVIMVIQPGVISLSIKTQKHNKIQIYSIYKIDSVSNNTPHTRIVSGETGLIFFAPPWLFL